jgi:formylmethanofuran dehydrogenase subunit C
VSALVFALKQAPRQRVDLSPLTPDGLRDVGVRDIPRIELASGNRRIPVGDLFDLTGGDASEMVIRNATTKLDFIGHAMSFGAMTVEGDAGAYVGLGMRGGRLHVTGNAGPWAASGLSDGTIEIDGDAGDFVGGALPGDMRGMSGGLVTIRGKAGERVGDRLRRGVVIIEGDAGPYLGSRMIAGTVVALGNVGAYPGMAMKRGTLLLRELPTLMAPTFSDSGTHDIGFLRLLSRYVAGLAGTPARFDNLGIRVRRLIGDAAVGGKGELLTWQN